jgi:hypothetical protein
MALEIMTLAKVDTSRHNLNGMHYIQAGVGLNASKEQLQIKIESRIK